MDPRPPPCTRPESTAAAIALGHLGSVEKQLQNEGLVFNKETVQHFEDAIKSIKKLEEERKHTIELWEEETIKNSNLRVQIKGFPELVMKEFEELVAAAHRYRFIKINETETSINEISTAIESAYSKQTVSKDQNAHLCEEEMELWAEHEEAVELLNETMEAKHKVNIEINELHNLKKYEEEEIGRQESAIQELKQIMAQEASEFKTKKEWLYAQIEEIKSRLAAKKIEGAQKKEEYVELYNVWRDMQREIAELQKLHSSQRDELSELFKNIRQLIKTYEAKKAEKEDLIKKKSDLTHEAAKMGTDFDQEAEALRQRIEEAEEKLETIMRAYRKLKNENDALSTQFNILSEEEDQACALRDQLAEEFEKLSNRLTEKLDLVAKRLVELRDLEEETDRLQNLYEETLQNQLAEITAMYEKVLNDQEELLTTSKEKSDAGKMHLNTLIKQNEELTVELLRIQDMAKQLASKLLKRQGYYKKRDAKVEAEITKLENEYHTVTKLTEEKEEQLKVNIPLSEQLRVELEELNAEYTIRKDLYDELQEEMLTLTKCIDKSTKETAKLTRLKSYAKNVIRTNREKALHQLQSFTHSLKYLERDIYEINRRLYILNGENDRLRAGIAFLKEDISEIESEAKLFRSERQETQKATKELHGLYVKKWIRDTKLQQFFLRYQKDIMIILDEYIRKHRKRNDKLDYVYDGLQLNYMAMESLLESRSDLGDEGQESEQ
ncbi:coiled-coil domain-containing protein 175-like isoform X2 [Podarcis raffonei]|uniref:coiled-coil domain-containing protein 175-like isoform X2 n=1 Tax=Podarcis raffonei TaxID=65483 RepID=UPI00232979BD|nr:coiled-coil domain-containing protein 175-like isoform X2 [Podarcis raffonei]